MTVQLKEKTHSKAPTAGPSADDRFGAGPVASNAEARIIQKRVVDGRMRITIARGAIHGIHVGMEGYVSIDGKNTSFQIDDVRPALSYAFIDAPLDNLSANARAVINPTSTTPAATRDIRSRVLLVSIKDGATRITIARGSDHGIHRGMQGTLLASVGHDIDFVIDSVDNATSQATVNTTPEFVKDHLQVVLHPITPKGSPVQRRATGAASTTDVQATADAGVASASSRLPHFDTIQRAFGKHDISNIQSQVGGAATSAAASLGAQAYATGNRVAFASSPDLHTAAHEAAHTIQQRHGAVGFQGLGAADDEHEHHADAVADAVVAGQSAEPLLDRLVGGSPTTAIQRKPVNTTPDDLVRKPTIGETPAFTKPVKAPEIGDKWLRDGAVCDGKDDKTPGCFMSDAQRLRVIVDLKDRIGAASTCYMSALAELRTEELLKKEEDLSWVASLALDLLSLYLGKTVAKVLGSMKSTGISKLDAALNGAYVSDESWRTRTENLLRSVSDKAIEANVKSVIDPLKKAAKDRVKKTVNTEAQQQKAAAVSYIDQLKNQCGADFQHLGSSIIGYATDAEIAVLWESFDAEYHTPDLYKAALAEKLERFRKSGVKDLGRDARYIGAGAFMARDTRVVWIEKSDKTKTLHYQTQEMATDLFQAKLKTNGGHADFEGKANGTLMTDSRKIGKPVPPEFTDVAIARSEQIWGTTPTIKDRSPVVQHPSPNARPPTTSGSGADHEPASSNPSVHSVEPNMDTLPDAFKETQIK